MNPFQVIWDQALKLWQLMFNPKTADTYRDALLLTWEILKEAAKLIWLLACIGLILADWLWRNSLKAGQTTRAWVNDLDTSDTSNLFSDASKALLSAGKTGAIAALSQAREQLGLPEPPEPVLELPAQEMPSQSTSAGVDAPAKMASPPSTTATSSTPKPESKAAASVETGKSSAETETTVDESEAS